MSGGDVAKALLVATLWGLNFVAVALGLDTLPPLFLAAMRYLLLALPVLLLVPRPQTSWRWLLGYGLGFGVAQFGFLFVAIHQGMPSGLSALVLQVGAPLTVLLSAPLLGERVGRLQVAGLVVACVGVALIAVQQVAATGLLPFVLTLLGGLGWAVGNVCSRKAAPTQPMRFALWMTVVPPVPLLALSWFLEGPGTGWAALGAALTAPDLTTLGSLLYVSVAGSVVGSWVWTSLMARHPASTVAPFSLLVPVVALVGGWLFLDEAPAPLSLLGGLVVLAGLVVGNPPARVVARLRPGTLRGPAASAPDAPPERTPARR